MMCASRHYSQPATCDHSRHRARNSVRGPVIPSSRIGIRTQTQEADQQGTVLSQQMLSELSMLAEKIQPTLKVVNISHLCDEYNNDTPGIGIEL